LEVSAIATKQTISEGGVAEDLCAPDVVSPAQFHEMWSGTPDRAAEFKLALAVLGQAIEDLERHHGADAPEHQRLYSLARRWVSSNDRHWPYSFVNVCDMLNLSWGRIRTKLFAPDGAMSKEGRATIVSSRALFLPHRTRRCASGVESLG
jgi:hypothetical protein